MSEDRAPEDQLSFQGSSEAFSRASDLLDTREETSTYAMEQESAKLQAEVQKLSQELEDLMSSRGIIDPHPSKPEFGRFSAVGEEQDEDESAADPENSFNPSEARKPHFSPHYAHLLHDSEPSSFTDYTRKEELPSPSFARSQGQIPTSDKDRFSEPSKQMRSYSSADPKKPPTRRKNASVSWRQVNDLLLEEGFKTVPIRVENDGSTVSDWETMCETLKAVLVDFREMRKEMKDARKKISYLTSELQFHREENKKSVGKLDEVRFNYEREIREARRELSVLQTKLDSWQAQCRQKDQTISELKSQQGEEDMSALPEVLMVSSDRDKSVFRKQFGRDPQSVMDAKVLGVIGMYEEMRRRLTPEPRTEGHRVAGLQETIKELKREISDIENQRKSAIDENDHLKQQLSFSESSPALHQIQSLLDLKSESQILEAIKKMLQVIRALPGLEHFIKTVSAEVVDIDASASGIDDIIPTIKAWKSKAIQCEELQQFRYSLCKAFSLDTAMSLSDIVRPIAVSGSDDGLQALNQVFLFVHEMKGLLQFAREELGMEGNVSVKEQVERVKYRMRR